jgi:hypothetical protein
MNETLNFALAGLFNLSFAGVPFILLGLAVALNGAIRGGWGGSRRSLVSAPLQQGSSKPLPANPPSLPSS